MSKDKFLYQPFPLDLGDLPEPRGSEVKCKEMSKWPKLKSPPKQDPEHKERSVCFCSEMMWSGCDDDASRLMPRMVGSSLETKDRLSTTDKRRKCVQCRTVTIGQDHSCEAVT